MKIKAAFFKMYLELLGNFTNFFINNPNKPTIMKNVFDANKYIESIDDEKKAFMKQFINTQNFISFIESIHKAHKQKNEVSYFLNGARLYQSFGKRVIESYCGLKLDQAIYAYENVILN